MRAFAAVCVWLLAVCVCKADENWRERLVPSFEADHRYESSNSEYPGAASFKKVTEALQKLQNLTGITEDVLSSLPGLPKVTDVMMNMSDGVQIWTRVVNPWPYTNKKPACLVRSPYGSMATQNLALIYLLLNGHAAVMQETRGTWRSGGVFDIWRGSSMDFKDTVDWITQQEWSNQEIYSMGASADGIDAIEETIAKPTKLYGEWLIWTSGDGHGFVYPGGAYRKDLMLGYFDGLSSVTHGASTKLVLPATQQNEAYGPWWYNLTACSSITDPSEAPGCHFADVKWPMIMNAGWWDLFHHTLVDAWLGLRRNGDATFKDDHVLIVGPLGHDIASKLDVGVAEAGRMMVAEADALVVGGLLTSEFWKWNKCSDEWSLSGNTCSCQGRVRFGKGDTWSEPKSVRGSITCDTNHFVDPLPGVAKQCQCQQATGKLRQRIGRVNMFVMGNFGLELPLGPGNYWTSLDDFPKATSKQLYLSAGAALEDSPSTTAGTASYQDDPSKPAPMIGGNNLPGVGKIEYGGSADQLPRENRSDVLVFDSAPLTADLPVVGAVSATIYVSSSAPDTDFFVTVSDLHPKAAKSMMVRFGLQRMRWRESRINKSSPMSAGKIYEANINMGYTAYIFPKGHSIRVSVSSSADPYYVVTTNTGENDMTKKVDPIIAKNAVHFAQEYPSRIILPEVSMDQIPENPHFTALGPFVEQQVDAVVI